MTLDETFRAMLREELRAIVREEVRAALAEARPAATAPPTELLTVDVVAARCGGVRPETVRQWIALGRLAARKAGHRYVVTPADLERFLVKTEAPTTISSDDHLALLMKRLRDAGKKVTR